MGTQPFPFANLPRVSRRDVQTRQQVCRRWRGPLDAAFSGWARLFLGDDRVRVTLGELRIVDGKQVGVAKCCAFEALITNEQQGAILVGCEANLVTWVIGRLIGEKTFALTGRAGGAEQGMMLFAVAALLQSWPGGTAWQIADALSPRDEFLALHTKRGAPLCVVHGTLHTGQQRGEFQMISTAEWLESVTATNDAVRGTIRPELQSCRATLRAILGATTLPAGDIDELGVGDVVLWPRLPRALSNAEVTLTLGDRRSLMWGNARYADDALTVLQTGQLLLGQRGAAVPDSFISEQVSRSGEIPVEVVVEIGRIDLSVAELSAIDAGDVISLNRGTRALLDVRAGGKLLGKGELVDVDGEAGVRIVEMCER